MNFIDYINDQERNLRSYNYVNTLLCKIKEILPQSQSSISDEELYRSHIPVDLPKFWKNCLLKLRELKPYLDKETENQWNQLSQDYISTLIQFGLEQEDVTMDGVLYASNMFILINSIEVSNKRFFHKKSYFRVLEILSEFNKSQEMISNKIIFLMDDFKIFLSKFPLPDDAILGTISVVHDYTYYSNDAFEIISTDVSFENVGYIAFVSLKMLAEQLLRQKIDKKQLYPILLCLTSSLCSTTTHNLSRTLKMAHQKNVRLFIKQNFDKFSSKSCCLVTTMLKFVCLCSDFDEFEAISLLIQQLPYETYQNLIAFLQNSLFLNKVEARRNLLNLVLPIFQHPSEYITRRKRLIQTKIFICNVIMLFMDDDEQIREKSLKIIAEVSEDPLRKDILKKIMLHNYSGDINRNSIQEALYKMLDKGWSKKVTNINYIHLICNLFVLGKDLISLKTLNRLRDICCGASPADLKPCVTYLKRVLKCYARKVNVTMNILSIFVKQILHPMATSAYFAKELLEFIFAHITRNKEDDFIWHVVNHLISNNFDVPSIFGKFNSLNLLRKKQVKIILEYKICNNDSLIPALKLLGILLQFVQYDNCRRLHEKLEESINGNNTVLSETEQYLIVYALIKIIEKKKPSDCHIEEINEYRKMQVLVSKTFFDQLFPSMCVNYVIVLLTLYANLIEEDIGWDAAACSYFEEDFTEKLTAIYNRKLKNYEYISRDVSYISELIILCKIKLTQNNFEKLKKIVTVAEHSLIFTEYIKSNPRILSACVLLYIKVCFVQPNLIQDCILNLNMIMYNICDEQLQIYILYALFDVCNLHLQYYDPIVPHLFNGLYSKNAYIRFISSKIIMLLVDNGHLRLMDGQYFLFMGLLSDEKNIISKNLKVFIKNKFVESHHQTIARHFVPSIIHYNRCYTHPNITLSKADQHLLKKQSPKWNDRIFIYYYLYQFLPQGIQFSILNHMQNEILTKVLNKTLPRSAKILRILEDALTVLLFTVSKDKLRSIKDNTEYYNAEIKRIKSDLLVTNLQSPNNTRPADQRVALKNIMTTLLQLLYSDLAQSAKYCQNLLFTIIVITDAFFSTIKYIINEESSLLKSLYRKLDKFYITNKDKFVFCLLTVNPKNLPTSPEQKNGLFYFQDFKHFELIYPHVITGDNLNK